MKNLVLPSSLFLLSSVLQGQITIGDNLLLEGAGSFGYVSQDSTAAGEAHSLNFQELIFEVGLDLGKVTAEVQFKLGDGDADMDAVFFNYLYNETITFSAGRLHSSLLYEEIHLTKRLMRARSQTLLAEIVPSVNTGLRGVADMEKGWFGVSWTDKLWDQPLGRTDSFSGGDGSVEVQLGFRPFDGVEIAMAYGGQDSGEAGPNGQIWDIWASLEGDRHLLVAEYVDFENSGAQDTNADSVLATSEYLTGKMYMLLGSYKTTENSSMSVRFSHEEQDGVQEAFQWTFTPAYEFGDHLTLRTEFSHATRETVGSADVETDTVSVEGLFRF